MTKKIIKLWMLLTLVSLSGPLYAYKPYQATVTVGVNSAHVSASNLTDLRNELTTSAVQSLIPFYTSTSAASFDINLRGIETIGSFAANSTTLVVQIPQTGDVEVFAGATRDESLTLYKDFIRDGGNHHSLLKAYAKYSPIDPIAGNPNSLMAQMAQGDYLLGRLSPFSGCGCWGAQPIVHQFQAGSIIGRSFVDPFDTTTISLPMRYSYSPNYEAALIIDTPFSYIRNETAASFIGSLGAGLRWPFTHNWSLTPVLRFGVGGSLDLCTSGAFFSTGLTSQYDYKMNHFVISMTNYAGYFTSMNLWLSGINFNYNLHNYVFKNGFAVNSCKGICLANRPIYFGLSFADSFFTKEDLYIQHYDEVGFSLITETTNPCIAYDNLSLGFSYQFGEKHYKGYYLNFIYQF